MVVLSFRWWWWLHFGLLRCWRWWRWRWRWIEADGWWRCANSSRSVRLFCAHNRWCRRCTGNNLSLFLRQIKQQIIHGTCIKMVTAGRILCTCPIDHTHLHPNHSLFKPTRGRISDRNTLRLSSSF